MPINLRFTSFLLLAAILAALVHFQAIRSHQLFDLLSELAQKRPPPSSSAGKEEADQSPYAFVAFLANNWEHTVFEDDNEDNYFYSTRVLGYQLMHNPETRTNTSIPFVVLTTKDVSERKRSRLQKDGATVIVADDVPLPDWFSIANPRWSDVMTKLRVFQQTQYEKILLLDADVFPVRRLDGVFWDPATETIAPLQDKKREGDEIPLPSTYMFAGMTPGGGREHDSETEEKYYASMAKYNKLEQVNAGFLLAAPSQEIYDYYTAVLHEEGRFDPWAPEQNLLIEAHRIDGPMPWKRIRYNWIINSANFEDYKHGVHALHEKLWREDRRGDEWGLKHLAALWDKARGKMEGYYQALDDPSPTM